MSNDFELWAPEPGDPDYHEEKTISLVPSWKAAASIYIMAMEAGTPEGKEAAKAGIMEMAEKFDAYIEANKEAA